ncbi:MAG: hypothetical protein AAF750_18005 [Planctomycetota bacterium]
MIDGREASGWPRAPRRSRGLMGVLLLLAVVTSGGGCGGYVLKGRVVEGPGPAVMVVGSGDERYGMADQSGSGAEVLVTVDPFSIRPNRMRPIVADGSGYFEVPIREQGAGFLEYEIRMIVKRAGYVSADETLDLPRSGRRLLVVLPRGRDRVEPKREVDVLREALEESGPYLRGEK